MLDALRKSAGSWVAKIFIALLVLSFAVWGIADIFGGYGSRTLVAVGKTTVSPERFRVEFQSELQRIGRQMGRALTVDEARTLGLDRLVVSRLLAEATLDEDARRMGLGVSEDWVAQEIVNDPNFQTSFGGFSRATFEGYLRAVGLSEAGYVATRIQGNKRTQIADALTGGVGVSDTLSEAFNRFERETRTGRHVTLIAPAVSAVADPSPETLADYYEANKGVFRAPEYRGLALLILQPADLAANMDVSDEDIASYYEDHSSDFIAPERRTVRQIPFTSEEQAAAAKARLDAGLALEDLIAELNLSPADTDLGTVARPGIFDEAVADAAFALNAGEISDPIVGGFRTYLVTITAIQDEARTPLEDVSSTIRARIADERALDVVLDVYDFVEDDRAAGLTLKEIAETRGLTYREIPAITRTGLDADGEIIRDIPESATVIAGAFDTEIGVETDPVQVGVAGSMWYEVTGITASRDRELDEVRSDVLARWKSEQVQAELTDRAVALVERIASAADLEQIAAEEGLILTRTRPLTRSTEDSDLSAAGVEQMFAEPIGAVFETPHANGSDRLVVVTVDSQVPPRDPNTPGLAAIEDRVALNMIDDLLSQYIADREQAFGATVNQTVLNTALGITSN